VPDLAKAMLQEVDSTFEREVNETTARTTVQFNPDTLKVTFANQIAQPAGGGDQRGGPTQLFVGAGTTKLALQLWFDVTSREPEDTPVDDVRTLTAKVSYFITPKPEGDKFLPPAVRFVWGSFQFDGIMESLEETLEFWSPEGRPLRASMSIALSQQKITRVVPRDLGAAPGSGGGPSTPGARPLTEAPQGSTMQGLAASQGRQAGWQAIAEANGIENPRLIEPGTFIDLNVSVNARLS
jgi:hypothetical protein